MTKIYENKNMDFAGLKELLTGFVSQRQNNVKPSSTDLGEVGDRGSEGRWEGKGGQEDLGAVKSRGKGGW